MPGLDCSGTGQRQVTGCYEHGIVPSGSKKWTSRGTVSFSRRTLPPWSYRDMGPSRSPPNSANNKSLMANHSPEREEFSA